MGVLVDKTTFAGGEVSPILWARSDLAKIQTACRIVENFVVLPEGGLTRRPGTRFVGELKDESRIGEMLPFRFSEEDAYVLVFNGGVMRVYRNGGVVAASDVSPLPFEMVHTFTDAQLPALRGSAAGNVTYLACKGVPPKVLTRRGHADWTIEPYVAVRGAVDTQNLDQTRTLQASGVSGSITLTASFDAFTSGSVNGIWRLDDRDLSLVPTWKGNTAVTLGDTVRNAGRVYEALNTANSGPNAPTHEDGDVLSGAGDVKWRYLHSSYGYVQITNVLNPNVAEATVIGRLPDSVVSGPTFRWYAAAWSDEQGWPEQIAQIDNKLIFARKNLLWATKSADFFDFELTSGDDSALIIRLVAPDGSLTYVQWILASGILVLGTRDSEWIVRGPSPFDPLTIANVRPVLDKTEGSFAHRPVLVDGGALFIGRNARRLHFAAFDRVAEELDMKDATRFARHILKGRAKGLAYQRDPNRLVWVHCQDGSLVSCTWYPKEDVVGFARHPLTNGAVEASAVIPTADASRQELWMIVRRTINGQTRRFVEVMQDFVEEGAATAAGAWYLDCALRQVFPDPVTDIAGLDHLEGQLVGVFVDGSEQKRRIVSGGAIRLDHPGRDVLVGLPIRAKARTLPFDLTGPSGSSRGAYKRASHVLIDAVDAFGGRVSVNGSPSEALFQTGHLAPGEARALFTGQFDPVAVMSESARQAYVEIDCDDAYPFTWTGCGPDLETGSR